MSIPRTKMKSGVSALGVRQTIEFAQTQEFKSTHIIAMETMLFSCSELGCQLEAEALSTVAELQQYAHTKNNRYRTRVRINVERTARNAAVATVSVFVTRSE